MTDCRIPLLISASVKLLFNLIYELYILLNMKIETKKKGGPFLFGGRDIRWKSMVCAVITYCVYILYDTENKYDNLKYYVAETPLIA